MLGPQIGPSCRVAGKSGNGNANRCFGRFLGRKVVREPTRLLHLGRAVSNNTAVTTPHSGYHWDRTNRRFFEGWYFKVTLPEEGESFALIFSVEDPAGNAKTQGAAAQVMGPGDGYIIQYSKDVKSFWAERNYLALGCCFQPKLGPAGPAPPRRPVSEETFNRTVTNGFQSTATFHQGSIVHSDTGAPGEIKPAVDTCSWSFNVHSIYGWGGSGQAQQSTAGWLAVLPVFEPHWQVMMAHGLATGWLEWGGRKYEFRDAPSYSEKNWGAGFPSKWFWAQCNDFNRHPDLSLTAVGAKRQLGLQEQEEDVGMIGIHYKGQFIELVPWDGVVNWDVSPWGSWYIRAVNDTMEAELTLEAKPEAGTLLRAPLEGQGLAPFCRDSFFGTARIRIWERQSGRRGSQLVDATSSTAAVEVGGGPWWSSWSASANMKEPLKSLVKLPIDVGALASVTPPPLRPPGL